MRGRAQEVLHSGKTVLVRLEHRDFIESIIIEGDFSIHPEHAISEVEKNLIGVETCSAEQGIANLIEDTLRSHRAVLIGATSMDIARVVKKAVC